MYIHPETSIGRNLESLIDSNGLASVVEALAEICYGKAAHLEENWQDKATAKDWERAGGQLASLERRLVKINEVQFTRE